MTGVLPARTDVDRSGCPARRHGSAWDAGHGCTCDDSRDAYRRYRKRRIAGLLPDAYVPAVGPRRMLQALIALGWSQVALAPEVGIGWEAISRIANGRRDTVRRTTADRIGEVFERLSMTPGPARQAAVRARRRGWKTPLAWYGVDIDDPAADPDAGAQPDERDVDTVAVWLVASGQVQLQLTEHEQRAAIDRLLAAGDLTHGEIARRVGCSTRARVQKRAERLRAKQAKESQ